MNSLFESVVLPGVFVFGLGVTMVSFSLLVYFSRSKARVGRAVAFMLFGEFVSCLLTTVFAYCELAGMDFGLSPGGNTLMRLFMFSVVLASTLHLTWVVSKQ
jgi:hypothetical protein